jgi:hypothetical protein
VPASKNDEYTKRMNERSVSFETDLKLDSGSALKLEVLSWLRDNEFFDRRCGNWTEWRRLTTRESRRICGEYKMGHGLVLLTFCKEPSRFTI